MKQLNLVYSNFLTGKKRCFKAPEAGKSSYETYQSAELSEVEQDTENQLANLRASVIAKNELETSDTGIKYHQVTEKEAIGGLSTVFLALNGSIDWEKDGLRKVKFDVKNGPSRNLTFNTADLIHPGQFVWIDKDTGDIHVADTKPESTDTKEDKETKSDDARDKVEPSEDKADTPAGEKIDAFVKALETIAIPTDLSDPDERESFEAVVTKLEAAYTALGELDGAISTAHTEKLATLRAALNPGVLSETDRKIKAFTEALEAFVVPKKINLPAERVLLASKVKTLTAQLNALDTTELAKIDTKLLEKLEKARALFEPKDEAPDKEAGASVDTIESTKKTPISVDADTEFALRHQTKPLQNNEIDGLAEYYSNTAKDFDRRFPDKDACMGYLNFLDEKGTDREEVYAGIPSDFGRNAWDLIHHPNIQSVHANPDVQFTDLTAPTVDIESQPLEDLSPWYEAVRRAAGDRQYVTFLYEDSDYKDNVTKAVRVDNKTRPNTHIAEVIGTTEESVLVETETTVRDFLINQFTEKRAFRSESKLPTDHPNLDPLLEQLIDQIDLKGNGSSLTLEGGIGSDTLVSWNDVLVVDFIHVNENPSDPNASEPVARTQSLATMLLDARFTPVDVLDYDTPLEIETARMERHERDEAWREAMRAHFEELYASTDGAMPYEPEQILAATKGDYRLAAAQVIIWKNESGLGDYGIRDFISTIGDSLGLTSTVGEHQINKFYAARPGIIFKKFIKKYDRIKADPSISIDFNNVSEQHIQKIRLKYKDYLESDDPKIPTPPEIIDALEALLIDDNINLLITIGNAETKMKRLSEEVDRYFNVKFEERMSPEVEVRMLALSHSLGSPRAVMQVESLNRSLKIAESMGLTGNFQTEPFVQKVKLEQATHLVPKDDFAKWPGKTDFSKAIVIMGPSHYKKIPDGYVATRTIERDDNHTYRAEVSRRVTHLITERCKKALNGDTALKDLKDVLTNAGITTDMLTEIQSIDSYRDPLKFDDGKFLNLEFNQLMTTLADQYDIGLEQTQEEIFNTDNKKARLYGWYYGRGRYEGVA